MAGSQWDNVWHIFGRIQQLDFLAIVTIVLF
jgi:hypothetical protein